jgi:hypothetical protein
MRLWRACVDCGALLVTSGRGQPPKRCVPHQHGAVVPRALIVETAGIPVLGSRSTSRQRDPGEAIVRAVAEQMVFALDAKRLAAFWHERIIANGHECRHYNQHRWECRDEARALIAALQEKRDPGE